MRTVSDAHGKLRHGVINTFSQFLVNCYPISTSGSSNAKIQVASTFYWKDNKVDFKSIVSLFPCHVSGNHWTLVLALRPVSPMHFMIQIHRISEFMSMYDFM